MAKTKAAKWMANRRLVTLTTGVKYNDLSYISRLLYNVNKTIEKTERLQGITKPRMKYITLFRTLNGIERISQASKCKVRDCVGCSLVTALDSINWLYANGYIRQYEYARRVEYLNAWTKIKCYALTDKGKVALYGIIADAMKGLPVVNEG